MNEAWLFIYFTKGFSGCQKSVSHLRLIAQWPNSSNECPQNHSSAVKTKLKQEKHLITWSLCQCVLCPFFRRSFLLNEKSIKSLFISSPIIEICLGISQVFFFFESWCGGITANKNWKSSCVAAVEVPMPPEWTLVYKALPGVSLPFPFPLIYLNAALREQAACLGMTFSVCPSWSRVSVMVSWTMIV